MTSPAAGPIPTSPPTMAHSTTLEKVPVPATRKLTRAGREGGRHQGPEAVAVGDDAERDHGHRRDEAQMGQEPPDDHQGHTHPGQHGRGCKLDRPERPGSAGLIRHLTSLPSLSRTAGFARSARAATRNPRAYTPTMPAPPPARLIVGPVMARPGPARPNARWRDLTSRRPARPLPPHDRRGPDHGAAPAVRPLGP